MNIVAVAVDGIESAENEIDIILACCDGSGVELERYNSAVIGGIKEFILGGQIHHKESYFLTRSVNALSFAFLFQVEVNAGSLCGSKGDVSHLRIAGSGEVGNEAEVLALRQTAFND